jgi:general secretion pathway protein N
MMKLTTVGFVLCLATSATASASPIGDRDDVEAKFETASAPVTNAGGVMDAAGPAGATSSSNRNEAAQGGNPLWNIPLSALTSTRDRPLFSVSRRSPTLNVETTAQPPLAKDPVPPAPPERPALKLIGTIVSPATSIALLRDSATQAVTRLRAGEATSGWLVKTVNLRSVIVEKGEQSAILGLPEPRDTPGEQPPLNSSPPSARGSLR